MPDSDLVAVELELGARTLVEDLVHEPQRLRRGGAIEDHAVDDVAKGCPNCLRLLEVGIAPAVAVAVVRQAVLPEPVRGVRRLGEMLDELAVIEVERVDEVEGTVE